MAALHRDPPACESDVLSSVHFLILNKHEDKHFGYTQLWLTNQDADDVWTKLTS